MGNEGVGLHQNIHGKSGQKQFWLDDNALDRYFLKTQVGDDVPVRRGGGPHGSTGMKNNVPLEN